jgi:hypothetical protein
MQMKRTVLKGLKITIGVLGAVVALAAVLVGATVVLLRTPLGEERLRRQIVARVNDQIQGRLDIRRLTFGGDRLALWGVSLRDPDGHPVADVARVEVAVSIPRLLHKEVRVTTVAIETPRLALVSDARGSSNLARATAPRKATPPRPPKPARPKTNDEGWVIDLGRFSLTDGDVKVAVLREGDGDGQGDRGTDRVHLAALNAFVRARYATGNGALDVSFSLDGDSRTAPTGPLRLSGEARVRGDLYRGRVDGILLGGTVRAIGTVDRAHLENADALIAVAIPALRLAGHPWGPLHIDGGAHPGSAPLLDLSLVLPGIVLTGKGGGADDAFTFDGRLVLSDLSLTGRALRALGADAVPELAGRGQIDLWLGGPFAGPLPEVAAKWGARARASIDHLRVADSAIDGLKVAARAAQLSSAPGHAALTVDVASLQAGATRLRGLRLAASIDQQTLSGELSIASPHAVGLALTGNLDPRGQSLALERFALTYPGAAWTSEGIARIGFGGGRLSLAGFRLRSQDQTIAIDGAKTATRTGDQIDARVSLHEVRLDRLPAFLFDPKLRLGGLVDADVKANGAIDNPGVVAYVRVSDARARGLSGINGQVRATLADHRVDGTVAVEAPFVALDGTFKLPAAVEAGGPPPDAPLDVRLEVSRLDLRTALRGATGAGGVAGRATLALRLTGSAGDPQVDLTATGSGLKVRRPATEAATAATPTPTAELNGAASGEGKAAPAQAVVDLGQARVHVTYADRSAHADLAFRSTAGGTLRVDAAANIDLSFPPVTRGLAFKKLPVHGKVVARDFDVAWLARFNNRVESLGGLVSADARLAGTVADPRFVGDVRWKNGAIVARGAGNVVAPDARDARVSATDQP